MNSDRPKISFTFPYRWLTDKEDRNFLEENLLKLARINGLYETYHSKLMTGFVGAYGVILKYHAYQPVKIPLTEKQVATIFKKLFPAAKLVSYETFFVQGTSRTSLPVIEIEIYY